MIDVISLTLDSCCKQYGKIKKKLDAIRKQPLPAFATYSAPITALQKQLKPFQKYKNILVIGNGGSRTASYTLCNALAKYGKKKVVYLTTVEPDFLKKIKTTYKKKDSLVVAISKSGSTVTVLETLFYFKGYPTLIITGKNGPLEHIAQELGYVVIEHPDIGGRYSGFSSSGLVPAILAGIDVKKVVAGAKKMYSKCSPRNAVANNPALALGAALYLLEQKGYTEVFTPVYSTKLVAALPLIIQLMHESVCKHGKGQTFFGDLAPESQHHTNQRFFGGKKNVCGLFIRELRQQDETTKVNVPKKVRNIKLREDTLSDLDNIPYARCLEYEFKGTYEDALSHNIPSIVLTMDMVTPASVGEFIAFWHYVAVYASLLHNVNPFNQPQVESSKRLSFNYRKRYDKKR